MAKGYGALITKARESAGLEVGDLAARIGQSISTVRRLEQEFTEPSVEQINALVSALPLSSEQLLLSMGVHLTPPAAARLPQILVERWPNLHPDIQRSLLDVVRLAPQVDKAGERKEGR